MSEVRALFTAPASGEAMTEHDTVEIVETGIRGDRYCAGTGTYSVETGCAVTLLAQSAIDRIAADHGIDISDGQHRRNVVIEGVDLRDLLDATVRLGTAIVRGTRPRPPCSYLEDVTGTDGIAAALDDGRGGICVEVLQPGVVAVGDSVELLQPDPETAGRRIVARLADDADTEPHDTPSHGTDSPTHDTNSPSHDPPETPADPE